jgi:hypothetical protein
VSASEFIRNRPTNVVRLFNYDPGMAHAEGDFRTNLIDLAQSLSGPVVLRLDTNLTVNFAKQFSGSTTLRSLLPMFDGNAIEAGSVINPMVVPDITFGGVIGGLTQEEVEMFLSGYFPILQNFGLVQNGGFETRDFTGWTLSGADTNDIFVDDGSRTGIEPHSGNYLAALGPVGSLSYLSQTLPTTAGASYVLSLSLNSPDGATNNQFLVSWNGNTLLNKTNLAAIGWTNIQFKVTATGTNTVLQFGSRDDASYLALDDISVVPAQLAITSINLSGTNLVVNGANGQSDGTYYVLTSTNVALPLSQWTRVATNVLGASGNFTITVTNTVTPGTRQRFYILQLQ